MLNFLGNIASTAVNGAIAQQNLQFQKENLEYQKLLQSKIFEREDNAIQRRVADLEKAGLSPTLATGQGAGAGQAISTQAPQNQFQMAMNLLPTVGSLVDTFQKIYNAQWYAKNGLPIGYNPSDMGSAFMMSLLGGKSDSLIDNSLSSIARVINYFSSGIDNDGDSSSGLSVGTNPISDIMRNLFDFDSSSGSSGSGFSSGSGTYNLSGVDKLYGQLRKRWSSVRGADGQSKHITLTRMYETAYDYLSRLDVNKGKSKDALYKQAQNIVHVAINHKPKRYGMWRY